MKLVNLGILFTIPMSLLAQEPVSAGDGAHFNAAGRVADSPSADANAPSVPTDATTALTPLTPMQKVVRRMRRMVEPDDLIFSAAGAGIDELRHIPPAWGHGALGLAYHTAKNILREFLPSLRLHKVSDTTGTGSNTTVAEQR